MTAATEELVDFDEAVAKYDVVMGIEVHVELNTKTKMFCGCATTFGNTPNSQVCPICLALPGSLPAVNEKAVESAIRLGLALDCQVAEFSRFARKNYFYPDVPKNYQTSQSDEPIVYDGKLEVPVDGEFFEVPIERAHMEEDTGKSLHVGGQMGRIQGAEYSLVDYNRGGIPLIEIVTHPIYVPGAKAPEVARSYVATLRDVIKALGISDVRMEQGSLRADINVSLRPSADAPLGTRTETKNVNSLRSIERAVRYEISRQAAVLNRGGQVRQETRHWHEDTGSTTAGRLKESAEEYRYFPDPDLVPVTPSAQWVEELRATLPELPALRRARLQKEWGFSDMEMRDVINADAIDVIEATIAVGTTPAAARKWWMGELSRIAGDEEKALTDLAVTPEQIAELQGLIEDGKLNDKLARQVLSGVLAAEGSPKEIVAARGLEIVSDDSALDAAVDAALAEQPEVLDRIREGKVQAAGAIVGAVMKATRGQADAARVRELVMQRAEEG